MVPVTSLWLPILVSAAFVFVAADLAGAQSLGDITAAAALGADDELALQSADAADKQSKNQIHFTIRVTADAHTMTAPYAPSSA